MYHICFSFLVNERAFPVYVIASFHSSEKKHSGKYDMSLLTDLCLGFLPKNLNFSFARFKKVLVFI